MEKTQVTVGDYERGRAMPPLPIILQLCEIFDVDLQTIVFHDMETLGFDPAASPSATAEVERLSARLRTQEQLTELQADHLSILKREIREHAPELARRLGL